MRAPVAIILNAVAGTRDPAYAHKRLAEVFEAHHVEARIWLAQSGAELAELARGAVQGPYATVVAGGGDGTVSTVAAALVDTTKALGVLPMGTLNHFAKDLHIPLDLEGAARNIIEGEVANVDVGEVNGHIFLNNSSLGLYPSLVHYRKKQQARLGRDKWAAFFWALLTVLRRYPFLHLRLSVEETELVRSTPFVFVGNNVYQIEGFQIGTRARLDQGYLSLYIARRTGRWGLLRLALRALLGRLHHTKDFDALRTKEVRIETRRPRLRVATDGEAAWMHTPLHYRVRPGALRVIVPHQGRPDEG